MPFAPEQQLHVTLRADQWNQVLALLAEGPFRVVNPLIQEMQKQLMGQHDGAQERVVPFTPRDVPPPGQPQENLDHAG